MNKSYISVVIILALYMFSLLYLTLFSNHVMSDYRGEPIYKLTPSIIGIMESQSIEYVLKNVFGNVLLFVPFGFLVPIIMMPLLKKAVYNFIVSFILAFLSTVIIEIIQLYYAHRVFDIDDIILNIIGFLIGLVFLWLFYSNIYKIIFNPKIKQDQPRTS